MKFVIAWTLREVSEESQKNILAAFDAWEPPASIKEMLNRVDGQGGGLIVETDSAEELAQIMAPFGLYLNFECYPVVDAQTAVEAVRANLK